MFGRSLFGDSPMGYFFENMIRDMDENTRKRKNAEAGVEIDEESRKQGVPSKNIPTKYHNIDFGQEHYICILDSVTTLYDKRGCFLFSAVEYQSLDKGMYLVKHEGDENYRLYKGYEKLSEPIFKAKNYPSSKFQADYCILGFIEGEDEGECIVDMNGEVVMEISDAKYSFQDHYTMTNNIAEYKGYYYNLHTTEKICYRRSYDKTLEADDNLLFVQADHEGYSNTDTKGVYVIDTMTGEFKIYGTPPTPRNPEPPPPTKEEVEERKIEASKPRVVRQGRNETCQCGSGKKFKQCCTTKIGQILTMCNSPEE